MNNLLALCKLALKDT